MTRHLFARLFAAAALALLLGPATVEARVFFRWGAVGASNRAIEAAGGKIAYAADITLNGGDAELTLFSFQKPLAEVVQELRRAFGDGDFAYQGGTLAQAAVKAEGRVLRLAALRLDSYGQTLVFKVDQSQREFDASQTPAQRPESEGIPSYPGSTPVFYAADKNAQMSLSVETAAGVTESIRPALSAQLAASGWTPAIPARKPKPASGMDVFLKNGEVCCLLVSPSSKPGEARITLLHKKNRVE